MPSRGRGGTRAPPSVGTATTTASSTGWPPSSVTEAGMPAVWARATPTASTSVAYSRTLRIKGAPSITPRVHQVRAVTAVVDPSRGVGALLEVDHVERGAFVQRPACRELGGVGRSAQTVGEEVRTERRIGRDGVRDHEDVDVGPRGRDDVAATHRELGAEQQAIGDRVAGPGVDSSLAYLRHLPVHELKIDKTFVIGMARDPSDAVIVRSTIDLAHNMGLAVVAEGVEDEATFDQLRGLGCDMVQDYWLSRPLGGSQIPAWIRNSAWAPPVVPELKTLRRV